MSLLAPSALAQVKFSDPTPNLSISPTVLWGEVETRAGFALPFAATHSVYKGKDISLANFNVLVVTETEQWRNLYLGLGLSVPLYRSEHVDFSLSGGWTADFSDIIDPKKGEWGIGAQLTFKF